MNKALDRDLSLLNNVICHYGVDGMEWYKNKADRYQNHAKYAMGKPGAGKRKPDTDKADEKRTPKRVADVDYDEPYTLMPSYKRFKDYDKCSLRDSLKLGKSRANDIRTTYLTGSVKDKAKAVFDNFVANVRTFKEEYRVAKTPIDKRTGFHLKDREMSSEEDAKKANPGYGDKHVGTRQNCVLCTVAYEMRRRGYDVSAQTTERTDERMLKMWFPRAKVVGIDLSSGNPTVNYAGKNIPSSISDDVRHKRATDTLLKQGEGARGSITIDYGWYVHNVAYEVKSGKVNIVDAQCGEVLKGARDKSGVSVFAGSNEATIVRLDNVGFNRAEIKEAIK